MGKIIKFGEDVKGYDIPVLNEREIRAGAGLLFVLMFVAIMLVILKEDFLLLKYAIVIFLVDILIRVLISPRFAPSLILGRLIVRNQVPEYVGAKQKKFAWVIGIVLGATMLVLQVIVNSYSPITGLICMICLVFLFFEAAFGICLGCKFYSLVYKEKAQYCPGEVCDVNARQEIQKTSWVQILIVLGYTAFIVAAVFLFNDFFSEMPSDLFGLENGAHSK
jgi:Domain of unknown function (DUF4395)